MVRVAAAYLSAFFCTMAIAGIWMLLFAPQDDIRHKVSLCIFAVSFVLSMILLPDTMKAQPRIRRNSTKSFSEKIGLTPQIAVLIFVVLGIISIFQLIADLSK